jgi:hypothetical protein
MMRKVVDDKNPKLLNSDKNTTAHARSLATKNQFIKTNVLIQYVYHNFIRFLNFEKKPYEQIVLFEQDFPSDIIKQLKD